MMAGRLERIRTLFGKALDVRRSQRQRFLESVSGTMTAAELKRMLAEDDELGNFLERPAWDVAPHEEAEEVRALAAGDVVAGRYEIVRFIGAGGMGEVYEVFDREVKESIALKTLRPEVAARQALVGTLRRELQLARRVAHTNVCRLFDLGRAALPNSGETVFLTMELLPGQTLSEIIRVKPCTPDEARPLVEQLLAGLGAAHRCGIVHRDFKTGNIMLIPSESGPARAVIMDFGVARDGGADTGKSTLSGSGAWVGTPAYMAPEQLQGLPVTPAADIYGLGVVMFEMLTGRLPFEGETSLAIALKRLRNEAPSPAEFVPGLPDSWSSTILACLNPDPSRRPQDTSVVARMLAAPEHSAAKVSRRWLIGGLATVGVATGVVFAIQPFAGKPLNPNAEKSFKRAEEFAKGRTADELRNAVQEYEAALKLEPEYAEAWAGLADSYSSMVNFGYLLARDGMEKARAAASRAVAIKPKLARGHAALGYVISNDVRRWLTAEPHYRRALALNPKDPVVLRGYGAWLGRIGRFAEAIAQVQAGLNEDPSSMPLNHQLAAEYFRARRFAEFHTQSLEVVRLQPREANSYLALARSYEWRGEFDQALKCLAEAEKYGISMLALCQRGCIEGARGDLNRARQIAGQVEDYWRQKAFQSFQLACLWMRSELPSRAVAALNAGFAREDSTILAAPTSPYFERIDADPEYRALKRTLGLRG